MVLSALRGRAAAVRLLVTRSARQCALQRAAFATQTSVVKSGIRNAYEELSPKLLKAFEGKGIARLDFGASHSAASTISAFESVFSCA
uniref:Uncharacterized protein n=1 Tax=Hyaloperonospora arabidopsidis (strain Emoy2) TaxID=559515 RepID=M4C2H8_HYAAE